ncbi:MAG: endolytic transglycosylase MltG, partial [Peptostreptococcaceae bacterium]
MNLNKNRLKIMGIISVILVILIGAFVAFEVGPYNKNNKKDFVVDIPSGSSVSSISNILYENKLIKNKSLFKVVVKLSGDAEQIKAGKYLINQTYSNKDILELLISGKIYNDGIKITIPEGSTSMEIIDALTNKNLGNKDKYKELINNPSKFYDKYTFLKGEGIVTLEGFLYPDTYYFQEDDSEDKIISAMLSRFNKEYTESLEKRRKEMNLTLQQILNLASIIEKEAVLDKDR